MKRTLLFALPDEREIEIELWDKMRILYEYSQLP